MHGRYGDIRNEYKILFVHPEEKIILRPRRRWEDNIKDGS
jgi:hypothetical protein